jgi:two-component system sensor histidine kinase CreC
VRTTRRVATDPLSSEMYVAAPIYHSQHKRQIVGVVTVIKPNGGMEPYIQHAKNKLAWAGVYLIVACLFLGALFSWALSHAISKLTHYADQVSRGKQQAAPKFWANRELNSLAQALDKMRTELDGQVYIEQTLHSFTHELKSPLTGIRGAAEVLVEPLEPAQVRHFSNLILAEVERLQLIVDRLLELARLENRQDLKLEKIAAADLISPLLEALSLQMGQRHLVVDITDNIVLRCEPFLMGQALRNLLQNAIDFTPPDQKILIQVELNTAHQQVIFKIHNFGSSIPEYAKERLFERFYSLPSPHRKGKGSGLGLVLSETIAQLHQGHLSIQNHADGGVVAILAIPL